MDLRSGARIAEHEKGVAAMQPLVILVGRAGFEPATNGLKV